MLQSLKDQIPQYFCCPKAKPSVGPPIKSWTWRILNWALFYVRSIFRNELISQRNICERVVDDYISLWSFVNRNQPFYEIINVRHICLGSSFHYLKNSVEYMSCWGIISIFKEIFFSTIDRWLLHIHSLRSCRGIVDKHLPHLWYAFWHVVVTISFSISLLSDNNKETKP